MCFYLLGFGGCPNLYISGRHLGGNGLIGAIKPGYLPLPIGGICPLNGTIGLTTFGLGGKL